MHAPPAREDVVAMLATFRDRSASDIGEHLDSLELAWLVHQVEQRYGVVLDLPDAAMSRMLTVTGAVEVLDDALHGVAAGASTRPGTAAAGDG
jgi:hypothetical protein